MVTPPTNHTIAERVRVAMGEESEVGLADATGIPRSTLRRRLTGRSPFTTDELVSIASHLDVSLVDLLANEVSVSA